MGIFNKILGRSEFQSSLSIKETITRFDKFDEDLEDVNSAELLLVFKSKTQQCWLIFTSERIYFVVDDIEQELTKVLWARNKENMVVDGRIDLHLKERPVSKESGELLFGKMNKGFLYTRSLFQSGSIGGVVLQLAAKHFL
ncbi:TPA: hypothetical protein ACOL2D_004571 [Vibrio parahaemolyticus]